MSGHAAWDLRYPLGYLLAALGGILLGYGLTTRGDVEMYARSQGMNINVWWGLVMVIFGLLFLGLAWRASRSKAS